VGARPSLSCGRQLRVFIGRTGQSPARRRLQSAEEGG
jgi:hypothetical protein